MGERNPPGDYTVYIGESIYAIQAFREKVPGRDRDSEAGDGPNPAAAQTVEK